MKSSIPAASAACPTAAQARRGLAAVVLLVCGFASALPAQAQTALADQPVFTAQVVPGNVAFPLSVEWPTVQRAAYTDAVYLSSTSYLGYFDPAKCYAYHAVATEPGADLNYFYPTGLAAVDGTGATLRTCGGTAWSGNFLNWAATPTIDPFRWGMTGGYRVVDTATTTILEKAWSSPQGNAFPDKSVNGATLTAATPLGYSTMNSRVDHLGNKLRFTGTGSLGTTGTNFDNAAAPSAATVYEVFVRVKVCDATVGVEANCVKYGNNWKPEGLIQKYSKRMRFSVFGYLNDDNLLRDGGVLRARQKFVGPTKPVPGSAAIANTAGEWDATTGIYVGNPDAADATATNDAFTPSTPVTNSGVMNYINKFGEIAPTSTYTFKSKDPVSELYYATLRYLKNKGNVASYTDMTAANTPDRTKWVDGFPVITNWDDPIQYSCQRNFILGIGDINTHNDKNLPGSTSTVGEPAMPASILPGTGDSSYTATINAITATDKVFAMQGLAAPNRDQYTVYNNSAGIAGLAYDANTRDIRPDLIGTQTVQTYWIDVLETGFGVNNQYYLAAKYGGAKVPTGFDPYAANAALQDSWWHTPTGTPDTNLVGTAPNTQLRPDNYFTGGRPDQLVSGLTTAFADIARQLSAFTTSFATPLPQVATSGNSSFSSKYDAETWTGEVSASSLSFDANGTPTLSQNWNFSDKLATQANGTGWDTNRRVVTWGGAAGVPFRATGTPSLAATAELGTLDTSYVGGNDSIDYLNYLRGDRSHELGCTANCGNTARVYRARAALVGDIAGSKARPVGPPSFPLSDATNPGYAAFKATWANRRTVVYVGANDGMMHAINGALVVTQPTPAPTPLLEQDVNAGQEMFAYVPRALFQGPNGTPNVDGLASLGAPTFLHHQLVDATPNVYDIDFGRTPGGTGATDWRSVLIGGLGKGGRAYYAMDVTDPQGMVTGGEGTVASKVLWEFSNATAGMAGELGFTFGEPVVVKTRKYGWVVIFPSGYNNSDGQGYFFFVNPRTGALLEKVSTGVGTNAASAGLAHANAFIVNASDGTADAVYAGDLLGNLWRLNVTATTGNYPAPTRLAILTDANNVTQPVTSRASIEVHPTTRKRFVMVGTGRLLDPVDIATTQVQSFYAIADGTNAAFNPNGAPLTLPYTRAVLLNNLHPLCGTPADTTVCVAFDPASQAGWYEDLGIDVSTPATTNPPADAHVGTGVAWRVVSDSTTLAGSVAFASILPNGSVCTPSGNSRVYGRDYAGATTTVNQLVNGTLASVSYVPVTGAVTDLRYLSVKGKATLISGTDTGSVTKIDINALKGPPLRRLNWRELQVVD